MAKPKAGRPVTSIPLSEVGFREQVRPPGGDRRPVGRFMLEGPPNPRLGKVDAIDWIPSQGVVAVTVGHYRKLYVVGPGTEIDTIEDRDHARETIAAEAKVEAERVAKIDAEVERERLEIEIADEEERLRAEVSRETDGDADVTRKIEGQPAAEMAVVA